LDNTRKECLVIFFELIGKIQWYLIGAAVILGLWYTLDAFRDHNSEAKSTDSKKFNKTVMTIWLTCLVFAIIVLIAGTVIPSLAQRGAGEVGGTLSMALTLI
jgi:hypothetical protein